MTRGTRHSPIFGSAPQGQKKRTLSPALLVAAVIVASLFLMAAARLSGWSAPDNALDRLAIHDSDIAPGMAELAAHNFPGSAYFYVEGAFDPAPEVERDTGHTRNPHIFMLKKTVAPSSAAFTGKTALDSYRALNCLTSAIYYEAANEPDEGQRAVAQVVLNRVRHNDWPGSICGVVYQGSERADLLCQFSFACDGSMVRAPILAKWSRARRAAQTALSGEVFAPVGHATYYHTLSVRPGWSSRLDAVAVIGAHIFYQIRGAGSAATAFSMRYNGLELVSGPSPQTPPQPPPQTRAPSSDIVQHIAPQPTDPDLPTGTSAPAAPHAAQPGKNSNSLPQSPIRPEYQDSGQPLI